MPDTPRTIQNIRDNGFTARLLYRFTARLLYHGNVIDARGRRWQVFDDQGRYLTELVIITDDGNEAVYWLSPSIKFSDDIEALRNIATKVAASEPVPTGVAMRPGQGATLSAASQTDAPAGQGAPAGDGPLA